ncbi:hypothetical protein [Romboutsia sp. MSSM.1001216sp_RTP31141st1_G3_RTP31141_220114]|uniref:hypothetical protein n=1 Tax=unclassified Romboutsia TaxID=2626894 RepID=UPI0031B5B6C5
MATKSILKSVNIKEKNLGRRFVEALESAQCKKEKEIKLKRAYKDVKKEEIKDLFRSF